jgi:LysM repeat protein
VAYHRRPMADPSDTGSTSRRISWGARVIAPLALVLALLAIYLVVTGSMSIDDDASDDPATVSTKGAHDGEGDGAETPKTYIVEEGDSFGTIAEQFGVSVKRLERLNPEIDPQTLNTGQEIKIR